ncbi:MAG: DUF2238 domain-containing protein [Christensenellales bacterium]|jgi:uncharacterized membrane protein YjdF
MAHTYVMKDNAARKRAAVAKWLYALSGVLVAFFGAAFGEAYRLLIGLASLLLIPGLSAVYRAFDLARSWLLELWIYAFAYLSVILGGCFDFYMKIGGFDKLVHMLSGAFTAQIALALYLYLERGRPIARQNAATALFFVFFTAMAVAALFEIVEFALAPVVGRDLQRVLTTGVTDTITDMIVCMLGALSALPLIARFYRGKRDPFTGAAVAFFCKNLHPEDEPSGAGRESIPDYR